MDVRVMASMRNCPLITRGDAPRAFRMPISLVRSATETSIMFMMPIPPTSREIPAMAARNVLNVPVMDSAIVARDAAEIRK